MPSLPHNRAACLHCLLLYPMCPLDYHLYSSVCSEAVLRAFHNCVVFSKLSKPAGGYQHNQLVYGVQECDGSIMTQCGYVFILVDENDLSHQQFCVAFVPQSGSHSPRDRYAFGTKSEPVLIGPPALRRIRGLCGTAFVL